MKNPTIATLLNIIPGLGYIYLKSRRIFGAVILASTIVGAASGYLNPALSEYYSADYNMWDYVGFISAALFIGAFMYDAYREAIRLNVAHTIKK